MGSACLSPSRLVRRQTPACHGQLKLAPPRVTGCQLAKELQEVDIALQARKGHMLKISMAEAVTREHLAVRKMCCEMELPCPLGRYFSTSPICDGAWWSALRGALLAGRRTPLLLSTHPGPQTGAHVCVSSSGT